jgi:DNA-binding NtrC family response regulator
MAGPGKQAFFHGGFPGIEVAFKYMMNRVLFCTFDPMLRKALYGVLRDDGYVVEMTEHPAEAVQRVFETRYAAVILDSDGIGLDVRDAAEIIRKHSPGAHVFFIGRGGSFSEGFSLEKPVDIGLLRNLLRGVLAY